MAISTWISRQEKYLKYINNQKNLKKNSILENVFIFSRSLLSE